MQSLIALARGDGMNVHQLQDVRPRLAQVGGNLLVLCLDQGSLLLPYLGFGGYAKASELFVFDFHTAARQYCMRVQ
ncbi:hypothetical protein [Pseudomonas sp. CFBP 13719]|uniref:hypothetical protein n=1 Tax=Pseudomonas sp. CFBP 13719 TaxID=2775303 RepID=UPI001781DAD1|nr:hypothetical protein [Pseudomonas sp. CFBP 13719]MBD8680278.1 hypothetical protein [Pseudomonas sp. CFBP 13719]